MKKKIIADFISLIFIASFMAVPVSAQVLYSPGEYPTAQGQYLEAPANSQPQTSVTAPPPVPPPAIPAARYVPPAPLSASPPTAPVSTTYTYAPGVSQPPQYAAPPPVPQPQPVAPTSYGDMMTYQYNPKADPAHPPYKTPIAHDPKPDTVNNFGVGTLPGFQIGLQVSDYRYQEFNPDASVAMRITGGNYGLTLDYNHVFKSGWFIGGDGRFVYGPHDYTGGDVNLLTGAVTPSTNNNISDYTFDVRAKGGYDFTFNKAFWGLADMGLSPYLGLGFRFLYDDNTSTDSNGVPGYERYSHYLYLPIGVTPRFRLTENSRLDVNMECDLLLTGWQTSALGDSISGADDLHNTQDTGYGLRGSIMYERPSWSIGPYFEFWDIGQSNTACDGAGYCGDEPHNQTIEWGLQGKYRFH